MPIIHPHCFGAGGMTVNDSELLTNSKILDLDTEIWYNRNTESEVITMLNRNENRQMKMCLVTLDELMPRR